MTRILKERAFSGTTDPKVQPWETEHRKVARRAAAEGIVLLKNEDNLLPLEAGSNVALYGAGAGRTIKGGTGSGDVNERENVSVFQGIKNAGFQVTTEDWIASYDKIYENARQEWKRSILSKTGEGADTMDFFSVYSTTPFKMPAGDQVQKPAEGADTETAIYVLSRIAGEGSDRTADKGDYYLNDDEYQILADICAYYKNVIVLINAGAQVDLSFMDEFENIKALLVIVQPGMEGGNAVADIILIRYIELAARWFFLRFYDCPDVSSLQIKPEQTLAEHRLEQWIFLHCLIQCFLQNIRIYLFFQLAVKPENPAVILPRHQRKSQCRVI